MAPKRAADEDTSARVLAEAATAATLIGPVLEAADKGKGVVGYFRKKSHYKKNLKNNYDMLKRELEKLIAFVDDIENGRIAREEVRNLSTYKVWKKTVLSIQEEIKELLPKYETAKFHKARLSREFENKRAEVISHINEGNNLIKQFPPQALRNS